MPPMVKKATLHERTVQRLATDEVERVEDNSRRFNGRRKAGSSASAAQVVADPTLRAEVQRVLDETGLDWRHVVVESPRVAWVLNTRD